MPYTFFILECHNHSFVFSLHPTYWQLLSQDFESEEILKRMRGIPNVIISALQFSFYFVGQSLNFFVEIILVTLFWLKLSLTEFGIRH